MITLFSPKIQGWWCLYYISCAWLFQLVTINMFDSYLRLAKETYHRLKHVFQQVPQFPWTKLLYTCPLCILLSVLLCNRKYFLVCLCDIIPSFLSKTTIIRWPFSLHPSLPQMGNSFVHDKLQVIFMCCSFCHLHGSFKSLLRMFL